jgi:hypothetical protein
VQVGVELRVLNDTALPRAGSWGQADRQTWWVSIALEGRQSCVWGLRDSSRNTGHQELQSGPEAIRKCAGSDGTIQKALQESGKDRGWVERVELRGKRGEIIAIAMFLQ